MCAPHTSLFYRLRGGCFHSYQLSHTTHDSAQVFIAQSHLAHVVETTRCMWRWFRWFCIIQKQLRLGWGENTVCSSSCESVVLSHFLSVTGTDLVASFLLMSSLPVQSLVGGATSCSTVLFLHLVGHVPGLFVFLTASQVPLACLTQVVLGICLYVYRQAHTVSHFHVNTTRCTFYTTVSARRRAYFTELV